MAIRIEETDETIRFTENGTSFQFSKALWQAMVKKAAEDYEAMK